MLPETAILDFVALVTSAPAEPSQSDADLAELLTDSSGPIHVDEFAQLGRCLKMAHHAGEIDEEPSEIARTIVDRLRPDVSYIRGFDDSKPWYEAISCVRSQPYLSPLTDRPEMVGLACRRLKKRGAKLTIGTFGPTWDQKSLLNFCRQVDAAASRLGGEVIINQLGARQEASNDIFEAVWLLGEKGLAVHQPKRSAVPVGWLLGLAAKHTHRTNQCRNPKITWASFVELATDIAASLDCQRYSQFDGMFVSPFGILQSLQESLQWRALFFTPQIPPISLHHIQRAFEKEIEDNVPANFAETIRALWTEFTALSLGLQNARCQVFSFNEVSVSYPQLLKFAYRRKTEVNADYTQPIGPPARNDSALVFLDGPKRSLLVRPTAMTVHAFCETIFTLAWKQLSADRARRFVGNIMEAAIASACYNKATIIERGLEYTVGKKRYEIDIAARTDDDLTLIETKAKSLTAEGQSGGSLKFFADYGQSFAKMLEQLARHEHYVRDGATPLANQDGLELSVEKIIVSPTSYGPIGDRMLAGALHGALARATLTSTPEADADMQKNLRAFNDAVSKAWDWVNKSAPRNEKGELDLVRYFMHVHWLDLGQIICALEKTKRVDMALNPIRHLTYGSRDFWTEYAYAVRMRAGG